MDSKIARWMRMKRYSQVQVDVVQGAERAAEASGKWWVLEGERAMNLIDEAMGPYWSRSKVDDERLLEITRFERKVFPVWAPILRNQNVTDLEAMHRADMAVLATEHDIDLGQGRVVSGPAPVDLLGQASGEGAI